MPTNRLLFSFVLCAASMYAGSVRELTVQGPVAPLNITPTFDNGYLLVYDVNGAISVYGPDGAPRYTATPSISGAEYVNVENACANRDGIVAMATIYNVSIGENRFRKAGGIALFDAAGKQTSFIHTDRYLPAQVAFAPDESFYTLGYQEKVLHSDDQPDYSVLRHYSRDGEELNSFVPSASLRLDPNLAVSDLGMWGLRVTAEKVGIILYRAAGATEWMEVDHQGHELGRWNVSNELLLGAFTSTGSVYACNIQRKLLVLDHDARAWRSINGPVRGNLIGADGSSLLFLNFGTNALTWTAPAQ